MSSSAKKSSKQKSFDQDSRPVLQPSKKANRQVNRPPLAPVRPAWREEELKATSSLPEESWPVAVPKKEGKPNLGLSLHGKLGAFKERMNSSKVGDLSASVQAGCSYGAGGQPLYGAITVVVVAALMCNFRQFTEKAVSLLPLSRWKYLGIFSTTLWGTLCGATGGQLGGDQVRCCLCCCLLLLLPGWDLGWACLG